MMPHEAKATVSGSSLYTLTVSIGEVPKKQWASIGADCAGGIDSLVELLQGRFSKGVMERICRQGAGLFPKLSEISFACSCPDYASMCKHVAAVLYGIGARLDGAPELLFCLRAVNENDLVARIDEALPPTKHTPDTGIWRRTSRGKQMLHRQAMLCTSCDLTRQRRQVTVTACLLLVGCRAQCRSMPTWQTQRRKRARVAHHNTTHQVAQALTVRWFAWLTGRHVS